MTNMKTEENIPGYPFTRKEAKQKAMLFQNFIKLLEWSHKGKEEEKDLGMKGTTSGAKSGKQLDLPF